MTPRPVTPAVMAQANALGDAARLAYHDARAAQHPDHEWDEYAAAWVVGDTPDGRRVWVTPLMYTAAIIVGDPHAAAYDDRWCYHTSTAALAAAIAWMRAGTLEPDGWHRHPASGRRRGDGHEWVNP